MNNIKGIWITWEIQRRNVGIAKSLGWPLYQINIRGNRFTRYLKSILSSIKIIYLEKPKILIVQNPSIVLTILAILIKSLFRIVVVVDAHNAALFPHNRRMLFLNKLSKIIQQNADITIVTNNQLKNVVEKNGGNAFVLPDKIPNIPKIDKKELIKYKNIVYICTFSNDEPYNEVIEAARYINKEIKIFFTGDYNGKIETTCLPANIILLGFVPDAQYWSLLESSDFIMDLTYRENCLVCGGYEAVALGKPMVLSNTIMLREFFDIGCVYVDNQYDSIAKGIENAYRQKEKLEIEIKILRKRLKNEWKKYFKNFYSEIERIVYKREL